MNFSDLTELCCSECRVAYWVLKSYAHKCDAGDLRWHCPNGHRQHFVESTAQKLERTEKELERQRQAKNRAFERENKAIRQRNAARGQVTKIKNRVSKGVCPCCNRTFQNVQRHIKIKHPEYVEGV